MATSDNDRPGAGSSRSSSSSQHTTTTTRNEEEFLDLAFNDAYRALAAQEVPVGCVFVDAAGGGDGVVIAHGRNDVNATRNATRHAEMVCIDQVVAASSSSATAVGDVFHRLSVYVTVEPCVMCAAALLQLGVARVVFGCRNDRFGGVSVFDVAATTTTTTSSTAIVGGVYRADEALRLLQAFYKGTNPSAPASKVKDKSIEK